MNELLHVTGKGYWCPFCEHYHHTRTCKHPRKAEWGEMLQWIRSLEAMRDAMRFLMEKAINGEQDAAYRMEEFLTTGNWPDGFEPSSPDESDKKT